MPFKFCTQVIAIINLVIKKQTREVSRTYHCALDHARATARSRPDNKLGKKAITYKNNAVSSDFERYSIFFAIMKECRYNRFISLKREVSLMNLYISAAEYDYHTLLKVAEMAGLAGIIGFHEAGDGYLVTFPDGENTEAIINDYKGRLRDLKNNIWMH